MSPTSRTIFAGIILASLASAAQANQATITLSAYPALAVADGKSTMVITAEVYGSNGRTAPDGTEVLFSAQLGTFREATVRTTGGIARATLIAGSIAGFGKITARSFGLNASATLDFELVKTRAELEQATDYILVESPGRVRYARNESVIALDGPKKSAKITYGDISITADDLQLTVTGGEVRARNARLVMRGLDHEFSQLYFRLTTRSGFGLTTLESVKLYPILDLPTGIMAVPFKSRGVRVAEINKGRVSEFTSAISPKYLALEDISGAQTIITAASATVFPQREVYMQRARVEIDGVRVLSLPLLRTGVRPDSPILGEEVVGITNNQTTLNYPHYLTLSPRGSSILRFRRGVRYTGAGATGGNFIDFEQNWKNGNQSNGGLKLLGLARGDWGANLRHFIRFDETSSAALAFDAPSHRSLFLNANLSKQFTGFSANFNSSLNRSLKGALFSNTQQFLAIEGNPERLGKSPFSHALGLTASDSNFYSPSGRRSQQQVGVRSRFSSDTIEIGKGNLANLGLSFTQTVGRNTFQRGLQTYGSASITPRSNRAITNTLTYEFVEDGLTTFALGRHRMGLRSNIYIGPFTASLYGSKSLDVARYNLSGDLGYELGPQWRFSGYFTHDIYGNSKYSEQSAILGYRFGSREIGISYASRTKKIGIEILGSSF